MTGQLTPEEQRLVEEAARLLGPEIARQGSTGTYWDTDLLAQRAAQPFTEDRRRLIAEVKMLRDELGEKYGAPYGCTYEAEGGFHCRAEQQVQRLRAVLEQIAAKGVVADAKASHSRWVFKLAQKALAEQ